MITFATVTSIDDTEFNDLFLASLAALDSGSYPWQVFPTMTDMEKRDHIRAGFDTFLSDGIVCRVSDDDGPLILMGGVQDGSVVTWHIGLTKPNAAGSRSYLYSDDYRAARDAYWAQIGVTQWILATAGADTPVHEHMRSRQTANKLGPSMTETSREVVPDLTMMDLTVG